jgi:glutathione S-transferase
MLRSSIPRARPPEDSVKLYDLALSPFAARVRLQIYAKGLDVPFVEPPGGLASETYKRINPTGKVPALELDDGSVVPESTVIGEYLEDRFPEPALRPADPLARARMRLLCRLVDLYVEPPLHALFPQVTDPKARDPKLVADRLAELAPRYDQLAGFLASAGPYALGPQLTLADCTLFPLFFYATRVHPFLGDKDPTASRAPLAAWWEGVRRHPAVARVDAELAKALAAALGAPS